MKGSNRSPVGVITIGIVALFMAGFFLLVIFGAGSYRNTVEGQNNNARTRMLLSYFPTVIKANDTGLVRVYPMSGETAKQTLGDKAPENGTYVLEVVDRETMYGFYIYQYDGQLMEEFKAADSVFYPENAQVIGQSETFTVETVDLPSQGSSKALRITTDAGSVLVNCRARNVPDPNADQTPAAVSE